MSYRLQTLVLFALVLLVAPASEVGALEPNAALKALIEAANKEGALNLSYPQSVVGGISGAR
ncbi:MAG: hypothetical protein ACREB3_01400, partial [Burkholderiales bacterium]